MGFNWKRAYVNKNKPKKKSNAWKRDWSSRYEKLQKLGFKNYQEYLSSDLWKETRKRYKNSTLPQYCLCCDNPDFELHHRSYVRIGQERLTDLIPLCRICHEKVHDYLKWYKTNMSKMHVIMRDIFFMDDETIRLKLEPFGMTTWKRRYY